MPRRTPALTAEARRLFAEEVKYNGWTPGGTIPTIAEATGLTPEQVRDAVFAPSADTWRRDAFQRR